MEQHNPTDKILREKFEEFIPEPSDRVWQAVRTQIPGPKKFGGYDLLGVGLIALTAGFFILHFSTHPLRQPTLAANELKAPVTQPVEPKPATDLGKGQAVSETEQAPAEIAHSEPIASQHTTVPAPFTPVRAKASVKSTLPDPVHVKPTVKEPITTIPFGTKNGLVVESPKPTVEKTEPKEIAAPAPTPPTQQGENFLQEGRQTDRSKIIKKVSQIAEKNLGIDTEFNEKKYDDYTKTSFSADFKLIKIKRVKTRKND